MKARPFSTKWLTVQYEFTNEEITTRTGIINHNYDTEHLSAIVDVNYKISLLQRLLGLMTIYLTVRKRTVEIANVPVAEWHTLVDRAQISIANLRRYTSI